jgi:hypothetical protein
MVLGVCDLGTKSLFVFADDFRLRVTLSCVVLCERARQDANDLPF